MTKPYISSKFRENIVCVLATAAVIETLKEDEERVKELFGPGWRYLKQANTLIIKSMNEGLTPNIGQEEALKIHKLVRDNRVVLMQKTEPLPKNWTAVENEKLFGLAEVAIGKQCHGCTIQKYKECQLYDILKGIEMPPACTEKHKCPYLQ